MKITNALTAEDRPNPHGVSTKPIYDSQHAVAVHVTLKPGEALKKHATPVDAFFYVLEGSGIVEIGDETQKISRDMIVDSPARVPHRLVNDGEQVFRILVVKVPKPTQSAKVL